MTRVIFLSLIYTHMPSIHFRTCTVSEDALVAEKLEQYRKHYSSSLTYTVSKDEHISAHFRDARDYIRFTVVWDGPRYNLLPEMGS